jgi:hypothetical protein
MRTSLAIAAMVGVLTLNTTADASCGARAPAREGRDTLR